MGGTESTPYDENDNNYAQCYRRSEYPDRKSALDRSRSLHPEYDRDNRNGGKSTRYNYSDLDSSASLDTRFAGRLSKKSNSGSSYQAQQKKSSYGKYKHRKEQHVEDRQRISVKDSESSVSCASSTMLVTKQKIDTSKGKHMKKEKRLQEKPKPVKIARDSHQHKVARSNSKLPKSNHGTSKSKTKATPIARKESRSTNTSGNSSTSLVHSRSNTSCESKRNASTGKGNDIRSKPKAKKSSSENKHKKKESISTTSSLTSVASSVALVCDGDGAKSSKGVKKKNKESSQQKMAPPRVTPATKRKQTAGKLVSKKQRQMTLKSPQCQTFESYRPTCKYVDRSVSAMTIPSPQVMRCGCNVNCRRSLRDSPQCKMSHLEDPRVKHQEAFVVPMVSSSPCQSSAACKYHCTSQCYGYDHNAFSKYKCGRS